MPRLAKFTRADGAGAGVDNTSIHINVGFVTAIAGRYRATKLNPNGIPLEQEALPGAMIIMADGEAWNVKESVAEVVRTIDSIDEELTLSTVRTPYRPPKGTHSGNPKKKA